jgi:hypothetical protein
MHWIMIIILGGGSYDDTPAITAIPFADDKACFAAAAEVSAMFHVKAVKCVDQVSNGSKTQTPP